MALNYVDLILAQLHTHCGTVGKPLISSWPLMASSINAMARQENLI